MKAPLSLIPLLPVTSAFSLGIIFTYSGIPLWFTGIWLIIGIVLALLKFKYLAMMTIAMALGQTDMWMHTPDKGVIKHIEGNNYLEADVVSVRETETSRLLRVSIIKAGSDSAQMNKVGGLRSQIVIPTFTPVITPGDRIFLKAKMTYPDSIEYFPNQLTYHKILKRQGISISGITVPDEIFKIEKSQTLPSKFSRLKNEVQNRILKSNLSGDTKEFLVTAITGDSSIFDNETRTTFAQAGTAHILALSGLHVGIIMALCALLFLPLILYPSVRKLRPVLIISVLWLFAFLTGLSASVTRAVIMASCLILASLLQKRYSSFNALFFAALIILLFDPEALFNISFQLSFGAVAGILLFGKSLNPVAQRNRPVYTTIGFVTMSIGAMIATGVISAFYFHSFPVYFLLSNILVAPILTPLIGGGLLMLLLSFCGIHSSGLCKAVDLLYSWVKGVSETISELPGAAINHLSISHTALTIWILAVAMLAMWLYYRRKIYCYSAIVCTATFAILLLQTDTPESLGVYLIPQTYRTDIAVCSPTRVDIISTASHREKEKIREDCSRAFSDYMLLRNIDTLDVAGKKFRNDYVIYNYPVLTAGSKHILIADAELTLPEGMAFDYILVCRGFKGSMTELDSLYSTEMIILSGDLHPKRLSNYIEECEYYGIKYTPLKNNPIGNLLITD